MSQYTNKGLYNGYDKNHKERDALDYYATPPKEVTNILNVLKLPLEKSIILEPCCGGGHIVQGIVNYLDANNISDYSIYATDIKDRGFVVNNNPRINISTGKEQDFLLDNYGEKLPNIDYIIMNPPFSIIEPFVIRALEIPTKGLLMLGRLQFLEAKGRYENILKSNPPSDVYVYVDRIGCYKNGDFSQKLATAQAYAWFFWNFTKVEKGTSKLHWIRRA